MSPLEEYFEVLPEGYQETFLALRHFLQHFEPALTEHYRWSTPVYKYKDKQTCYLYFKTKGPRAYIAFAAGKHLDCPLLQSDGQKIMRFIPLFPDSDIPVDAIGDCLHQVMAYIDEHGSGW